jgi:hypothetical protein
LLGVVGVGAFGCVGVGELLLPPLLLVLPFPVLLLLLTLPLFPPHMPPADTFDTVSFAFIVPVL